MLCLVWVLWSKKCVPLSLRVMLCTELKCLGCTFSCCWPLGHKAILVSLFGVIWRDFFFCGDAGTDWEDPEDPTVIAENELLGAASSIDAAAKKLANLRPRVSSTKVIFHFVLPFDRLNKFSSVGPHSSKSLLAVRYVWYSWLFYGQTTTRYQTYYYSCERLHQIRGYL